MGICLHQLRCIHSSHFCILCKELGGSGGGGGECSGRDTFIVHCNVGSLSGGHGCYVVCQFEYLHILAFQISLGLSDGLLSSDIGHHRGLVPVLLEDDQDMEEGIQKQTGLYGNSIFVNLL